jgi:lysozyme family protein
MADFQTAYNITMSHEGGYVNDPDDSGGETYAGIARRYHPDWEGWKIIDEIKKTRELQRFEIIDDPRLKHLVGSFYKKKYWDVNYLDHVKDQAIANELFDTGVNMGTGTAAKMLQQSLNLLNRNEREYSDIAEDGAIGNITLNTLSQCPHKKALLKTLNGFQFMRYYNICRRNPAQEKFMRGWLKRINF